jgi:dCTP deaminase
MILSDSEIMQNIEKGAIVITPFRSECLGSNSYDVHLGKSLGLYRESVLDCRTSNQLEFLEIGEDGFLLQPGKLYLGVTEEFNSTKGLVPFLEGKSSTGRLGISVHATAGKGDEGFANHWTLELSVIQPVRVYAGMPIAQLIFFRLSGAVTVSYDQKASAKYREVSTLPQASAMWKNFIPVKKGKTP